jgi:hypothetical protein
MPLLQVLPTFTAWNNMNNASPTGMTDPQTGQPYYAGGLNLGDYFDATEQEANTASYLTNGLLHAGRYRMVQVSANATAANVKAGTVGYIQPGTFVQNVLQLVAGSGMTVGTYTTTTTGGGATTQATIQVTVLTATTVSITVLTPGVGFTSLPTVTAPSTGGTPPTFVVEMGYSVNMVTSADIATNLVRPVVFLNSITPGNYGFVQELGIATVLSTLGAFAQVVNQFALATSTTPIGLMIGSSATFTNTAIGYVLDPVTTGATVNTPFKVLLNGPVVQD